MTTVCEDTHLNEGGHLQQSCELLRHFPKP